MATREKDGARAPHANSRARNGRAASPIGRDPASQPLSEASLDLIAREKAFGARNYDPLPVVLARGNGSWVADVDGHYYLDLMSAYSAVSFGHAHPRIVGALVAQAHQLGVTSRAYYNDELPTLLERLAQLTGLDRALPANGGAEAVETAIKAARKWGHKIKGIPEGRAEIIGCAGNFGTVLKEHFGRVLPVTGLAGDQQAASIGQACLSPGDTKATYGTGAFVLTNTGTELRSSRQRLRSTIAWQLGGVRSYALEGSVFVAGSLIKWLRDELGLIATAEESESLARSVPDSGGVRIVPGHSGLGAPHWRPNARGAISGLSFSTGRAQLARAALEAMAHQTHDLMRAFAADGAPWRLLRIDGGMTSNDWMAQDLADVLDLVVERPDFVETTALGAAMLAAVGCGLYDGLDEAAAMRGPVRRFEPRMDAGERDARLEGWREAVDAVLAAC